jgi:hypothetical protein
MEPIENFTHEFSVKGLLYNPQAPAEPSEGHIAFKHPKKLLNEQKNDSHLSGGIPVDANLAAHLIQNFLKHTIFDKELINEQKLESLKNSNDVNSINELYQIAKTLLDKVLAIPYGITFTKEMVLKTLSQSHCEGLRFYLCGKETDSDKPHVSLIMVGVDKFGSDLHFTLTDDTKNDSKVLNGVDLLTKSMLVEFATPPPPSTKGKQQSTAASASLQNEHDAIDDNHVLLKLATKYKS